MNKAVEFVQAKVDEFGWKVFGREDALQKINKLSEFGIDRQKKIIKILEGQNSSFPQNAVFGKKRLCFS